MTIDEAQREMRSVYLDGVVGSFVSSAVWFASTAFAALGARNTAMLTLIVGGAFIFPLTLLVLRVLGRSTAVGRENPLSFLAMQVAFTIPLAIPLVLAAARSHGEWFYAGFLIVVGAHYVPFVTLYGLRLYAVAGGSMVAAGIAVPSLRPGDFTVGGWLGGALLALLGVVLAIGRAARERRTP